MIELGYQQLIWRYNNRDWLQIHDIRYWRCNRLWSNSKLLIKQFSLSHTMICISFSINSNFVIYRYLLCLWQAIPEKFHNSFGKLIPAKVQLILQNGKIYNCQYSESTGKNSDIMALVNDKMFERKDFMLLTYRRSGKFDTVIFDSSKNDKLLVSCSSRNCTTLNTTDHFICLIIWIPIF